MAVDYLYVATLDDSQVLKALENIEKRAAELNNRLDSTFKRIDERGVKAFKDLRVAADAALAGLQKDVQSNLGGVEKLRKAVVDLRKELNATSGQKFELDLPAAETVTQDVATTRTTTAIGGTDGIPQRTDNLKKYIAAELQQLSVGDQVTQDFIQQAAAAANTAEDFVDIISQSGRLSAEQLELAQTIGALRNSIDQEISSLDASETAYEQALQAIRQYQAAIEGLDDDQRAAAQAAIERAAAEVEAARQSAAAEQRLEAQRRIATQTLIKNAQGVDTVRNAVGQLVNEQGEITIVLGRTNGELSEQEQQLRKVLQSSQATANVINRLDNEYEDLVVTLNQANFPAPRQLTNDLNAATAATQRFNKGLRGNILAANLLADAIRTGVRGAIEGFRNILDASSKTAEQFKITRLAFTGIFDGDTAAAERTFAKVRQLSREFGADIADLAVQVLPSLEDPETQLGEIASVATRLTLLPGAIRQGKNLTDATIALTELLAGGDPRSLRTRFNLEQAGEIASLAKAGDQGAALETLDEVLNSLGITEELVEQSLQVQKGRFLEVFRDLFAEIGTPFNEGFAQALSGITDFVDANKDELGDIGVVLGEILKNLIELGGQVFFGELEAIDLNTVIEGLRALNDQILRLQSIFTEGFDLRRFLEKGLVEGIRGAFEAGGNLLEQGFQNLIRTYEATFNIIGGILDFFGLEKLAEFFRNIATNFQDFREGALVEFFDAWREQINNLSTTYDQLKVIIFEIANRIGGALAQLEGVFDFRKVTQGKITFQEWRAAVDEAVEAAETRFNPAIKATVAELNTENEALAEGNRELDERIEESRRLRAVASEPIPSVYDPSGEVDEDLLEAQQDVIRKRLELERDFIDKELELEIDAARKRADIWQDYYDKLRDLQTKYFQDIDDAYTDYNRDLEDAEIEAGDKLEDISDDSADKRADIWRDYYRKLEELRRKFQFDAQEAIRQNDAIAFLRLRRQLEFDKREARIRRDQELADLGETQDRREEEVKKDLERERRDLQRELERQLEDLRINYSRRLAAARQARLDDLRDQQLAEERKREDLLMSYEQQLADFAVFEAEKIEGTEAAIAKELELIATGNEAIVDKESEFYKLRIANFEAFIEEYGSIANNFDPGNLVGGPGGVPGSGDQIQQRLERLKRDAYRLANQQGVLTERLAQRINMADTIEAITAILRELGAGSGSGGGGGSTGGDQPRPRRLGGPLLPGANLVGELGPELVLSKGFSGQVLPLFDRNNYALNVPRGGSVGSVTNNTLNTSLSMLDPSSMSPGQLAIIQNMVAQIMLQVAGGLNV